MTSLHTSQYPVVTPVLLLVPAAPCVQCLKPSHLAAVHTWYQDIFEPACELGAPACWEQLAAFVTGSLSVLSQTVESGNYSNGIYH